MKKYIQFSPLVLALCAAPLLTSCDEDDDSPTNGSEAPEAQEPVFGTVTDRDGNEYTTVSLGDYEWMAENLRTAPVTGLAKCYDDEEANCEAYGLLYTLEAVMENETADLSSFPVPTVQGICPDGWRLPNRDDYGFLPETKPSGFWNANELKADSDLWFGSGAGNNASGFSALPGGMASVNEVGDFSFFEIEQQFAAWFVTTPDPAVPQFGRFSLVAGSSSFGAGAYQDGLNQTDPNAMAHSCRCVRDL